MWNLWYIDNKLVFDVRSTREVCWQHGDDNDIMVLNMDVSALTNLDKTGYDGLVKNFEENFQFAFYDGVGLSNILHFTIPMSLELDLINPARAVFGKMPVRDLISWNSLLRELLEGW
ncbi:hypothetical protein MTR_2g086273 [Medicago truncatula]|uniref:Uncharacterized protein n=1 Tax=Medicago truncatula TaxID=3880 RepID=A0A072VB24_MEDTR|nr:hypothetical protein MTR_2g086273 [Medicago truncatula]